VWKDLPQSQKSQISIRKELVVSPEQERVAKTVLDAAFEVHSYLGLSLLESAEQTCLLGELKERGVFAESEKPLPVICKGIRVDCAYRVDILVERDKLLIENKSVKEMNFLAAEAQTSLRANLRLI
jgi:GxxExxY protein